MAKNLTETECSDDDGNDYRKKYNRVGLRDPLVDKNQMNYRANAHFVQEFNIRKSILQIYNRNSKNVFSGTILENCNDYRNEVMVLLGYLAMKESDHIEMFKYTLHRNDLSHRRALYRDGRTWGKVFHAFK